MGSVEVTPFAAVWWEGDPFQMIELGTLPGTPVDPKVLGSLKQVEVLAYHDGPLLVLAKGPPTVPTTQRKKTGNLTSNLPDSSWLLNWCDSGEEDNSHPTSTENRASPWLIYAGFRVSEGRLAQFLDNHLSLREAILHCEFGLYLYKAKDPLRPVEAIAIEPRRMPDSYLPIRDIALNGKEVFSLAQADIGGPLEVGFHIISKDGSGDQLSWTTSGPFQTRFQRYLSKAARYLKGGPSRRLSSLPPDDWTALNTRLAIGGSYRIFCAGNTASAEDSGYIAAACRTLKEATEIEAKKALSALESLSDTIGPNAIDELDGLLALVSAQGVAVTVRWCHGDSAGELTLNKRVADEAVPALRRLRSDRLGKATLTVTLTDKEAAYLARPVKGRGGWQSSLRSIQSKLKGNTIVLTADEVDRIVKQAQSYGQGGFQDRLSMVIQAIGRWETAFAGIQ